jgi:hypothetical protein
LLSDNEWDKQYLSLTAMLVITFQVLHYFKIFACRNIFDSYYDLYYGSYSGSSLYNEKLYQIKGLYTILLTFNLLDDQQHGT